MFRDARFEVRLSAALRALVAGLLGAQLSSYAAGAAPQPSAPSRSSPAAEDETQAAPPSPGASQTSKAGQADDEDESPVSKTDAEWKRQLTRKQYRIARLGETEPPFKGKYWKNKKPGQYHCICCQATLFNSHAKFESGTGWPSFYAPVKQQRLVGRQDFSDGTLRIEVLCARCGAHLGHVFADGPPPTGLRFCINSASLNFQAADAKRSHNRDGAEPAEDDEQAPDAPQESESEF
jgi:peptide-methionine (R)-S-oxide reductase